MKKTLAILMSILMLVMLAAPAMAAEVTTCSKCGKNTCTFYMVVTPTCTEEGYTLWKCSDAECGIEAKTNVVPAVGHVYGAYSHVDGTCTKDAYDHAYCTICGAEDKINVVTAPGHAFGEKVYVGATCTISEHYIKTCATCGFEEIEKIMGGQPYTGHNMVLISGPETCKDVAENVYQCSKCGWEDVKEVAAIDHVDADDDGTCDVCETVIPAPEEPHGFYAQIIKWISEIVEAFKAFIASIKGDSLF